MLNWIKILKKKFTKMHPVAQFGIAVILVVIVRRIIHLLVYSNYLTRYLENFGNPKSITYFYMNGCGHCEKFTPIWDKFSNNYKGPLSLKKMERKEAGDNTLKKYNVEGFPTVLMIDENGNGKPFEGDRTISGLERFANQE
jgi:thiol-disulfide isomerase/thioredoxin